MTDFIGHTIQEYRITQCLRRDMLFAVYLAENAAGETAWLWIPLPSEPWQAETTGDLVRKLDLLRLLAHPNLLPILSAGAEEGAPWWLTPALEGRLLSDIPKPFSVPQAGELALQAAGAVEYLHQQHLQHEYLAPETILVRPDGSIVLFHYAIANILNLAVRQSAPEGLVGYGIGNPSCLPPERVEGRESTQQSDLYMLGAVTYRLLTGTLPLEGRKSSEIALHKLTQPLSWPNPLPQAIPGSLIRFVHKCMARVPANRFASAKEARAVLARTVQGKPTRIPLHRRDLAGAPRRSHKKLWAAIATAVLLFGAFLLYQALPAAITRPTVEKTAVAAVTSDVTPPPLTATLPPANKATAIPPQQAKPTRTPAQTLAATAAAEPVETAPRLPVLIETQPPVSSQPITPETVAQIQEVSRLGTGRLNQVAYDVKSRAQAIASTAGVIIFLMDGEQVFLNPGKEATSVAFTPDGSFLGVGLANGEIQLWDWRLGEITQVYTGHEDRISRILFTPGGHYLVSASFDQHIRVWSLSDGTSIRSIPAHPGPIWDIAISADGNIIASCGEDGMIKVWTASGNKLNEFRMGGPIHGVALTPDGEMVAGGAENGFVQQWYVRSGQISANPYTFNKSIWGVEYVEDGYTLAITTFDGKTTFKSARFLDNDPPERIVTKGYEEYANLLGGDFLFTTYAIPISDSAAISVRWDGTSTLQSPGEIKQPYEDFSQLAFSPNSQYLAASGKLGHTFIWDVTQNHLFPPLSGSLAPGRPFSASSEMIATIKNTCTRSNSPGGEVVCVDMVYIHDNDQFSNATPLSQIPTGSMVLFAQEDNILLAANRTTTKYWDVPSRQELVRSEGNNLGCQVSQSANDGHVFSVYSPVGLMDTWDEKTRVICARVGGFTNRLAAIAPSRSWLVYINENGLLELFDTQAKTTLWRSPLEKPITTLAFSPDERLLVTGANDGTITFWDITSGKALVSVQANYGAVRALAFAPDGTQIASASVDGTIRIWEVLGAQ